MSQCNPPDVLVSSTSAAVPSLYCLSKNTSVVNLFVFLAFVALFSISAVFFFFYFHSVLCFSNIFLFAGVFVSCSVFDLSGSP